MENFRWGVIAAIVALFFSVVLGIIGGVAPFFIFIRALIFSAVFFGLGFGLRFVVNSFFPELLFPDDSDSTPDTYDGEEEEQAAVTMDSTGEYAVPELYNIQDSSEELGNIEDLISGVFTPRSSGQAGAEDQSSLGYGFGVPMPVSGNEGIDRNNEEGYNDSGGQQSNPFKPTFTAPENSVFEKPQEERPAANQQQFTPSFGGDSGLEGLPDLDMMAMAFSSFTGGVPAAGSAPSAPAVSPIPQALGEVEELEPDRRGYNTGNKPQTLQGEFDPKSLAEGIRTVLSKE